MTSPYCELNLPYLLNMMLPITIVAYKDKSVLSSFARCFRAAATGRKQRKCVRGGIAAGLSAVISWYPVFFCFILQDVSFSCVRFRGHPRREVWVVRSSFSGSLHEDPVRTVFVDHMEHLACRCADETTTMSNASIFVIVYQH